MNYIEYRTKSPTWFNHKIISSHEWLQRLEEERLREAEEIRAEEERVAEEKRMAEEGERYLLWGYCVASLRGEALEDDSASQPQEVPETEGVPANTIVNTSCEHFSKEDFNKWYLSIPDGCLIILQSNNYKVIEEHVNCVSSLNEFKTHVTFDELVFEGELKLEKYIRYMLIGYKWN